MANINEPRKSEHEMAERTENRHGKHLLSFVASSCPVLSPKRCRAILTTSRGHFKQMQTDECI